MKNSLRDEIKSMLSEQNLENLSHNVVEKFKGAVENMVIKLLKSAEAYKDPDKDFTEGDIHLAICLERASQREILPPNLEVLEEISSELNSRPLALKESCGLRIPKENLGNCNYQLENPNKKMKVEMANKLDNYGNCFRFLMPQKHYTPNNMGGFVIKNTQTMRELPMKITIRPKFNLQQNISMLKKN